MFGMFGLGWLMMLLVFGLPILVVLLIVAATTGHLQNWMGNTNPAQSQATGYQAHISPTAGAPAAAKYCSHCGAGLQAEWTHCPQCGAPIQP